MLQSRGDSDIRIFQYIHTSSIELLPTVIHTTIAAPVVFIMFRVIQNYSMPLGQSCISIFASSHQRKSTRVERIAGKQPERNQKETAKKRKTQLTRKQTRKTLPEHHAISMETQNLQCIEIKRGGGQTKNFLR